jgi:Major Facilitator Superfamily
MLGMLTYTIIEGPEHGWRSAQTLGGFALSAVLLGAFVGVERRVAHPMLDVSLFRDRRFSAASGAVTVTFFALFGFIFLITQYFQFIRGYGTLSTGARILPVAISIAVASVIGAALAPRIGTKAVVTTGLVSFALAFLWISTVTVDAPYGSVIVPQMILMGIGMGLISTPATESILLVLPPARAGVGSAVNDATRELGGTLGVAVIGSIFSSVYAAHLAHGLFGQQPAAVLAQAQDSVRAAQTVGAGSPQLTAAMQDAFLAGLSTSCVVIGLLCLAGAIAALAALPGRLANADNADNADNPDDADNVLSVPDPPHRPRRAAQRPPAPTPARPGARPG